MTYVLYTLRTFANVHLHTYFCIRTFAVRTLYPYVLLHTNFRVRTFAYVLLTYVLYTLRTFAYEHLHTNFCIRTFGIRTFHRTYFCIRTFAYEFLRTYFCRTYFIPYVLLHTNFRVRTFAYVLLTYVFYPLRIFAYELLRTYFCPTYFSDTYFGPTIVRLWAEVHYKMFHVTLQTMLHRGISLKCTKYHCVVILVICTYLTKLVDGSVWSFGYGTLMGMLQWLLRLLPPFNSS